MGVGGCCCCVCLRGMRGVDVRAWCFILACLSCFVCSCVSCLVRACFKHLGLMHMVCVCVCARACVRFLSGARVLVSPCSLHTTDAALLHDMTRQGADHKHGRGENELEWGLGGVVRGVQRAQVLQVVEGFAEFFAKGRGNLALAEVWLCHPGCQHSRNPKT